MNFFCNFSSLCGFLKHKKSLFCCYPQIYFIPLGTPEIVKGCSTGYSAPDGKAPAAMVLSDMRKI